MARWLPHVSATSRFTVAAAARGRRGRPPRWRRRARRRWLAPDAGPASAREGGDRRGEHGNVPLHKGLISKDTSQTCNESALIAHPKKNAIEHTDRPAQHSSICAPQPSGGEQRERAVQRTHGDPRPRQPRLRSLAAGGSGATSNPTNPAAQVRSHSISCGPNARCMAIFFPNRLPRRYWNRRVSGIALRHRMVALRHDPV